MRIAAAFVLAIASTTAPALGFIAAPPIVLPFEPPAQRYARLDKTACEAELTTRGISFASESVSTVLAPVRLTGALHGVTFHSALPAAQRATSAMEILDCRLVLALDDFSAILARYDVVDVVHLSVYRPGRAKTIPARQHTGALAMDAAIFVRRDGSKLQVERDFHGKIGAITCGAGGPSPITPEATALRGIVCDAANARLFNVLLTPDYNWAHRNHFHLEVTPGAGYFLVR